LNNLAVNILSVNRRGLQTGVANILDNGSSISITIGQVHGRILHNCASRT
jgi:hypothetical protein